MERFENCVGRKGASLQVWQWIWMEIIQTFAWEVELWMKKLERVWLRFYFPKTLAFTPDMIYNHIIWCHIMMDSL